MALGIPESTIELIKDRTDLADLISGYGIMVKRSGGTYWACCPFHHEKTPSFSIQPSKGFYHCFGCGESGDAISFVMKQEGLTFAEAAKKLAQAAGITIEEKEDPEADKRKRLYALHTELAQFFRRCLKVANEAQAAREYLLSRAIPEETAEEFTIGYAPLDANALLKWGAKHGFTGADLEMAGVLLPPKYPGGNWFNRFGGRLMFTIRDKSGRAIAFSGRILTNDKKKAKYVNSPETPIFRKSGVLYAFDRAAGNIVKAPKREAIVCEGQIDVIRCHASGFKTAVASEGTAFTEEHVRILEKCADSVVLVFDGDNAGRKAAVRTGREFLARSIPVKVASLPPDEDPDSLLRNKGAEAFQACLDNAESIAAFQARTMREAEALPDSIDAVSRVSRAVLETIAKCPSAVMRASLLQEAAAILHIPASALESDLRDVKDRRPVKAKAVETPVEAEMPERSQDAAAPENNPPTEREIALMEIMIANAGDREMAQALKELAPDAIFSQPVVGKFVKAFVEEANGAVGTVGGLRDSLSASEVRQVDKVFLSAGKESMSERDSIENMLDQLALVWIDALHRKIGRMAMNGTPEEDKKRLQIASLSKSCKGRQLMSVKERLMAEIADEADPAMR